MSRSEIKGYCNICGATMYVGDKSGRGLCSPCLSKARRNGKLPPGDTLPLSEPPNMQPSTGARIIETADGDDDGGFADPTTEAVFAGRIERIQQLLGMVRPRGGSERLILQAVHLEVKALGEEVVG